MLSTFTDDIVQKLLKKLGFSTKEATVYLVLVELGQQPASVVAKKTGYPKSTVLFLFENLLEQGYIRKSQKGRTQYFYADPQDLKLAKEQQLNQQQQLLDEALPLLEEFKSPYTSEPKLTFYEGIAGCQKAYSQLLTSKTEILEFGAHNDLVTKFGKQFMDDFIQQRIKKKLHLKAISKKDQVHKDLCQYDEKHLRQIQFFSPKQGTLYSSIAIFEDKVLLLNLHKDAFAILIQNYEMSETLKTIFMLQWK